MNEDQPVRRMRRQAISGSAMDNQRRLVSSHQGDVAIGGSRNKKTIKFAYFSPGALLLSLLVVSCLILTDCASCKYQAQLLLQEPTCPYSISSLSVSVSSTIPLYLPISFYHLARSHSISAATFRPLSSPILRW